MSTFKIGEKVVFIGGSKSVNYHLKNNPELHEIVTIYSFCRAYQGNIDLVEYPIAKNGVLQSFKPSDFRKLDYQFAENLLAELTQSAKSEYQLN